MASDEDVYSRKKTFLEGQIRRLTTTLAPSRDYKAAAASPDVEDSDKLTDTMVENAIYKLNLAMRKHYRLQYSAQAVRHVATQLGELYRAQIEADQETGIHGGESSTLLDILAGQADLTDPKVIASMPDVWPILETDEQQEESVNSQKVADERYEEKLAELQSLSTALISLRRKQKHYESFLSLARETLGNPKADVQPNIVTKTGPIVEELRKMRTLLAKVSEHLANGDIRLRPHVESGHDPMEDVDVEKWDELQRVLDRVNRDGLLD